MSESLSPDYKFLTWKQLRAILPVSRTQIYRMMDAETFPRCIKISENRVAWLERDIIKWVEGKTNTNTPTQYSK